MMSFSKTDVHLDVQKEADSIILNIWNEVENTYANLPDDEKRSQAQQYGLSYVFRKSELGRIGNTQNT